MSKIISSPELASMVSQLLLNPAALDEDMSEETYANFMTKITETLCEFCGGEVAVAASPSPSGDMGAWFISVQANDSSPEDGGIWRNADPEGDLYVGTGEEERAPLLFDAHSMEKVGSIMMQDIVGDYSVPERIPEWEWVERNASYAHACNGQDAGVWEFVMNLSRLDVWRDVPPRLVPVFQEAKQRELAYLIFHQG